LKNNDHQGITIHHETNTTDEAIKNDSAPPSATSTGLNLISRFLGSPLFTPLLYTASGILVLFALIIIFNTFVLRLKVETAVVSSLIETITAPASGYITDVFVTSGEKVKKGTPLVKIESIDLERELQLARVQVEESKLNIRYYQQLLMNEQQRLEIYKKIGDTRVISAQTSVTMTEQGLLSAKHNFARVKALHKKHYMSEANLESERTKYVNAQEQSNKAKAQLNLEHHSLNAVHQGMYFTGTKTEGIEHDLYAELEAAQKRAELNENRVKIYERLINKLTLKAPFDGKITQILKSAGNTTDTTKPLIFIEQIKTNKTIIAYLTQDEIIHVGASGLVKIYIPSSGKTYHGKIIDVNRTDGFIDVVKAEYRWRDFQIDRSAMVTISIQKNDQNEFNKQAFSGMPAIVYFSQHFHYI
jgi:multidrug resistance efflux pump